MIGRVVLGALALAAPLAFSTPAKASSDSTCYATWKVKQTQMTGCSGVALLSPGNDTRINLLMLLHDRHGSVGFSNATNYNADERRGDAQPFTYGVFSYALGQKPVDDEGGSEGYGTHCVSNERGMVEFEAAVKAAKGIPEKERATLIRVRQELQPDCQPGRDLESEVAAKLTDVKSKAGEELASYLIAAAAFYEGSFALARGQFEAQLGAQSPWQKEAATYMLARSHLNDAMTKAFDEYGSMQDDAANKTEVADAERTFKAYLKAYPKGRYAASARGLLRRVYWLAGDEQKLLAEYAAAFGRKNMDGANVSLADLVDEMDTKLPEKISFDDSNDAPILAMLALKAMRHGDDADDEKPISRAQLQALKPRFAGQEGLFNYLLAAHALYVGKDADGALRALPANPIGNGYLAYSQRALRALALDSKGDPGARSALVALLEESKQPFQRGTMELALAMHDERNGGLERIFAAGSPVQDPEIRERLLRFTAGPKILRAQAGAKDAPKQEREVALYTLLYKQLTRGAYKDFINDQGLIPAGTRPRPEDDYTSPTYTNIALFKWSGAKEDFACPSLKTLATALAGAPKDAPSLLCLGEFIRLNGLDGGSSWPDIPQSLDVQPAKDELGGAPSLFTGKAFSRLEAYKGIIANPAADANSKAYALYRAVYCYAPSGYNSCGGVDVAQTQRKAWFNQLKKSYPTSPWATKLKYYW